MKKSDLKRGGMMKEKHIQPRYLNNDIVWDFYDYIETDKGLEWFKYKWWGYNDTFWWENVAIQKDKQIATVVGDKGTVKRFQIDYRTGVVKEIGMTADEKNN